LNFEDLDVLEAFEASLKEYKSFLTKKGSIEAARKKIFQLIVFIRSYTKFTRK
jgi:hypothetical protein